MDKRLFLIYDIISSGIKTSVFCEDGRLITSAYRPLVQFLEGKKAESSVASWTDGMKETTSEALERSSEILELQGASEVSSHIAGICLSGMSQVCLLIDRELRPLHEAWTWSDTRASEIDDPISEHFTEDEIYRITGSPDTPMSSIRKLYYIKQRMPEIYEKAYKMIQCKDYLALSLTGEVCTDYSDAASTGAFDIVKKEWCEDILAALGIDKSLMPRAIGSNEIAGFVTKEASETFSLREGTPVLIGAGDILCSAIGAGVTEDGELYMSLGSSSWAACCSKEPPFDKDRIYAIDPHAVPERYLSFVNYQTAGVVFKWLKNEIFRLTGEKRPVEPYRNVYPYEGMAELINESEPGAHGLLFLPFILPGESPHPESYARGSYIGLSYEHTRADMERAALEGVCFQLRAFAERLLSGRRPEMITVTGIASHEETFLQMLADVTGVPVRNTELHDTPDSIGAAVLTGKALGIYEDYKAADIYRKFENVFQPDFKNSKKYDKIYEVYTKAFSHTEDILKELEKIS